MSKHVLVVDDSKIVCSLILFVFKSREYHVTTAEDGLGGFKKLYCINKIDFIVSDINI